MRGEPYTASAPLPFIDGREVPLLGMVARDLWHGGAQRIRCSRGVAKTNIPPPETPAAGHFNSRSRAATRSASTYRTTSVAT